MCISPETNTPTIKDIKGTFFIPSYQRGYKWRKRDVGYLISDLAEYDSDKPYYMQPLVVAKGEEGWIVVDGQQRLTTFFLIWRVMKSLGLCNEEESPKFSIKYDRRNESTSYLEGGYVDESNENVVTKDKTPDIRNFKCAEQIAKECFENIDLPRFKKNFFEKATFLWYDLGDPDKGPAMFERLNGKRIALTDVELCKVLLLSPDYARPSVRSERGIAWQMMEYTLQDDRFYSFISTERDKSHDKSRMELLLKIICNGGKNDCNRDYEDYPIYSELKDRLSKGEDLWKEIIRTFHVLQKWYDTKLYYNIIGFLIQGAGVGLAEIAKDAANLGFEQKLFDRLKKWVDDPDEIRQLEYRSSRTKPTLLLFNILCDLHQKKGTDGNKLADYDFTYKFPFDLYSADNYDLEHVHATNSKILSGGIECQQWAVTVLGYLKSDNKESENARSRLDSKDGSIIGLLERVAEIKVDKLQEESNEQHSKRIKDSIVKIFGKDGFEKAFEYVNKAIEPNEEKSEEEFDAKQNSIGNLALLNMGINRDQAYAAAPFAVKSSILKDRISSGYFVPEGTKKMFDKSFRGNPSEMYHWRKTRYPSGEASDEDAFIEYIIKTIRKIIK